MEAEFQKKKMLSEIVPISDFWFPKSDWPQSILIDVRAKLTRNSSQPDIEKIKKDVRTEMEAEFRKKINALASN